MKNKIINIIKEKGNGVSFVELDREIVKFKDDLKMALGDNNIYVWFGLSEEAITVIKELLNDRIIELHPTEPLVYYIDGSVPNVPIAKRDQYYKSERWLPMTFNKGPMFPF
ncbi:MAG: hypothetical protein JW882_10025 [Deltaproteobacteria bacterium]|nr:hypothetical protein [Deltaproteobacteria bacterium]